MLFNKIDSFKIQTNLRLRVGLYEYIQYIQLHYLYDAQIIVYWIKKKIEASISSHTIPFLKSVELRKKKKMVLERTHIISITQSNH